MERNWIRTLKSRSKHLVAARLSNKRNVVDAEGEWDSCMGGREGAVFVTAFGLFGYSAAGFLLAPELDLSEVIEDVFEGRVDLLIVRHATATESLRHATESDLKGWLVSHLPRNEQTTHFAINIRISLL